MDQKSQRSSIDVVSNVVAMLVALATCFVGYLTWRSAEKADNAARQLSAILADDQRVDRVYSQVANALDKCVGGDDRHAPAIKLALTYANAALRKGNSHDEAMRKAITEVVVIEGLPCNPALEQAVRSDLRVEEKINTAQEEGIANALQTDASVVRLNAVDWRNFDLDILWCEGGGALAEQQAERIRAVVAADEERRSSRLGYTRKRPVSATRWIANRFPQKVDGVQLHVDDLPSEKAFAERIVNLIRGEGVETASVHISPADAQVSQFYVSALICP